MEGRKEGGLGREGKGRLLYIITPFNISLFVSADADVRQYLIG